MSKLSKLRAKKEQLQKEVVEMEKILKFDNAKTSLGIFTNGKSDEFLTNTIGEDGNLKTEINKTEVVRKLSNEVKGKILSKNTALSFADSVMEAGVVDNALNLGVSALAASFAKKNMKSSNWKKKLLGFALIYLAPFLLKFISKKLDGFQKKQSISSMEKLI